MIGVNNGPGMSFFRSRYPIIGLYLWDEPETALPPNTQLELLKFPSGMGQFGHAQFIISTHSPILLSCPGSIIYSFDHIPIEIIAYGETEPYRVYKNFLNDPSRSIKGLL